MRIEVRNGDEYLIDAPADVNDCTEERNFHTCDTHFDGQHLATASLREDGSALIVERWPIEPVRDLAGRIRALVQEYAGRFADADDAIEVEALYVLLDELQSVAASFRRGVPLTKCVDALRERSGEESGRLSALLNEAASDVERIICEAQR